MGSLVLTADTLGSILNQMQSQLQAIATAPMAQYSTIQNGALCIIDSSNTVRVRAGVQTDGTYGIRFFNASGQEIINQGQNPDGTYGMQVFNGSGTLEVNLGQQVSSGIYGLQVQNSAGVMQQVAGTVYSGPFSALSATNTSYTTFSGASTTTVTVGNSGNCLVGISGDIATNGAGQEGFIGILMDGSTIVAGTVNSESVGNGGVSTSTSTNQVISGLSPGSHTFVPQYKTANNGSFNINFYGVNMWVQPL